ncbi:MAG: hypothetical protein HYW47_01345 [Deltaproteobacteria bacterium]|nr:hypothetical protein [Deltaproteobacteria bacterium]
MVGEGVIKYCIEEHCASQALTKGYCRLHYIKNWKHLKMQEKLKSERQLNEYIERMMDKYPADYIKMIREDLASDKDLSDLLTHDHSDSEHEVLDEDTFEVLEELKKGIK